MGKLVLYGVRGSPPVRAVMLTLNALGLDYDFLKVNLWKDEHKRQEFLEKNPQHTVPVLEDNGKFICDSHAIGAYLVRKYGKSDELYPKDYYQRAIVDQRLHFDSGVLFANLRVVIDRLFFKYETEVPQEVIDNLYDGYNLLEAFLKDDYMAGEKMTLADFSIISSVSSVVSVAPIDRSVTPKLAAWMDRIAQLPYYESTNGIGAKIFTGMVKAQLDKN